VSIYHLEGQKSASPMPFNQGIPDFAIWDFPITFQDKFFDNKMKKFPDSCILK